jgi:hypothetical protein
MRSKPILFNRKVTAFASRDATIHPMSRTSRKPTSLGTKENARFRAELIELHMI